MEYSTWTLLSFLAPEHQLSRRSFFSHPFCPLSLYFLWENAATLLILQSVGIGLASIALYLLTLEKLAQKWLAPVMAILFLFNPYLHRISTFDFHPIALAIPIFLWMLYCLEKG